MLPFLNERILNIKHVRHSCFPSSTNGYYTMNTSMPFVLPFLNEWKPYYNNSYTIHTPLPHRMNTTLKPPSVTLLIHYSHIRICSYRHVTQEVYTICSAHTPWGSIHRKDAILNYLLEFKHFN